MKNQKQGPKGSKPFFGAVTPSPNIPEEVSSQEEFRAVFSGPYDKENDYNPLVKPQGLRLTTPTCPPIPEELESRVQEKLANEAFGEVVASWKTYPHNLQFVTYPSGKKLQIPR